MPRAKCLILAKCQSVRGHFLIPSRSSGLDFSAPPIAPTPRASSRLPQTPFRPPGRASSSLREGSAEWLRAQIPTRPGPLSRRAEGPPSFLPGLLATAPQAHLGSHGPSWHVPTPTSRPPSTFTYWREVLSRWGGVSSCWRRSLFRHLPGEEAEGGWGGTGD